MLLPRLPEYIVFTTLLAATPGAATAVIVRNVLDGGRVQGLAATVGVATANATYAFVSALGAGAVLVHTQAGSLLLRYLGAAYLFLLGIRSIWRAWQARTGVTAAIPQNDAGIRSPNSVWTGLTQGLLTNLANPSVVTFYLVIVPSFLPAQTEVRYAYAVLAAIHIGIAFAFHGSWVWALHSMRSFWTQPRRRRALETLTGVALLILALRVASPN